MNPNEENTQWQGTFAVPTDRTVALEVTWQHSSYLVARHSRTLGPITGTVTISLEPDDYETTGVDFDIDMDGESNLAELISNSNPDDADNIDVVIPRSTSAPGINGSTGIVWESNPIADWRGNELKIDNLMIDLGADRADDTAEFRWQALHFDNKLYIIAFAEILGSDTPQADSSEVTRDDTLNIYIDGDNSKGTSYDGINDFHIAIAGYQLIQPLDTSTGATVLKDENGDVIRNSEGQIQVQIPGQENTVFVDAGEPASYRTAEANGRVQRGANSLPLPPSLQFSTGTPLAEGQLIYELVIELADLGIELGRPFGIELQIDDDIEGGARNARYGWKHPSRVDQDTNNTSSNPSYMATVRLAP